MFRQLGLWQARGPLFRPWRLFRPWPSPRVWRVWPQALELARVLVRALVWRVRPRLARALELAWVLARALVWRVRLRLARALVWLVLVRA